MLSFKELIAEEGLRGLHPRYAEHELVTHIPLLDSYRKDGKVVDVSSPEKRLDALLSYEPIHHQSEPHVRMHNLINRMEDHASNVAKIMTVPPSRKTGHSRIFSPVHAQLGRMINNGATFVDLNDFLDSKYDHTDKHVSRRVTQVMVDQLKSAMENFQNDFPEPNKPKLAFNRLESTVTTDNYPGKMSLKAFLQHPDMREDFTSLSTQEFYTKHLQKYSGKRWSDLTVPEQRNFHVKFSQARAGIGMLVDKGTMRTRFERGTKRRHYGDR